MFGVNIPDDVATEFPVLSTHQFGLRISEVEAITAQAELDEAQATSSPVNFLRFTTMFLRVPVVVVPKILSPVVIQGFDGTGPVPKAKP